MQVKKVLTYAAIAFVAFYLFTRPAQAAGAVKSVFDIIIDGANALATFFSGVFTGN